MVWLSSLRVSRASKMFIATLRVEIVLDAC